MGVHKGIYPLLLKTVSSPLSYPSRSSIRSFVKCFEGYVHISIDYDVTEYIY